DPGGRESQVLRLGRSRRTLRRSGELGGRGHPPVRRPRPRTGGRVCLRANWPKLTGWWPIWRTGPRSRQRTALERSENGPDVPRRSGKGAAEVRASLWGAVV
ncbi:MAG: hypothetical protein AVDCRST_MAG22-3585, partial [uncultured Rubrobacteraceae bacterium]